MAGQLSIRYREFYDVPGMFVVEQSDSVYLFNSVFVGEKDEYSEYYVVHRLPKEVADFFDTERDWTKLGAKGVQVGRVRVGDVCFDETKRLSVDERIFVAVAEG